MNNFQKQQAERISAIYGLSSIQKSEDDNLEKGGVGSGRKIGETRSGKSVLRDREPDSYSDFSHEDHHDAYLLHKELSESANKEDKQSHTDFSSSHRQIAEELRSNR